ncbi:MAG: hypothetical protein ABIZ49_09660 [Opitutaceae bacterium]
MQTASAYAALGQVGRQTFEQSGTIFRAVGSALFEFHDISTDEPVAEDETLVDRRGRATDRLRVRRGDRGEELAVVHGGEKNAAAVRRQSQ